MSDFFAAQHALPSFDGMGYAQNRLMRDTEHRSATSVKDALAQDGARLYLLADDRVAIGLKAESGERHGLFCQERAEKLGADIGQAVLLGTDPLEDNRPRLAAPIAAEKLDALAKQEGYEVWSLRGLGLKHALADHELSALAQARSLLTWHANHQFCARCGSKTLVTLGGARRDCPSCGAMHFPRTDPCVIMLAIHTDEAGAQRCLLGHHTRFDGPMYSTLAGFMEQGEMLEAAVRREIFEEAGIEIGAVRYMSSQPWPFPSSLMLGCYAEALSHEITLDETELSDAQWFTREQVREMMGNPLDGEKPHVPGGFSIASWLIRHWAESAD